MTSSLQPVLVMPVYRGSEKFRRALNSIRASEHHFRRIVISLNSSCGSQDEQIVSEYRAAGATKIEVIQVGEELPWIPHQFFWLDHLEATGERADDWVMWFAHDDELRPRGITDITDENGNWPLQDHTIYLGPWGMRYDPQDGLFDGDREAPVESWTSFPLNGPLRMTVAQWIADQLTQPTYMNMSGCVTQLRSFQQLRNFRYRKPGGMRIEMATAAAPTNTYVQELAEPVVITYTSAGSDRTTYARVARKDDTHLVAWLANYVVHHPAAIPSLSGAGIVIARQRFGRFINGADRVAEDWRRRATVTP